MVENIDLCKSSSEFQRKLNLVDRALWERHEFERNDDLKEGRIWVENDNWAQVTTNIKASFLNGIYKCKLNVDEASEVIKNSISYYEDNKIPFRFKVSPLSNPSNLETILKRHGLYLKENLYGLYADSEKLKISANANVNIEELTDDLFEDWLEVQRLAWNVPEEGILYLRLKGVQVYPPLKRGFIAYYNNTPVGSSGLCLFENYAFFVGSAVVPQYRGMGIYKSLLDHRMQIAKTLKLPIVIHCLENTSAPICLKLGFEMICEIKSYEPCYSII